MYLSTHIVNGARKWVEVAKYARNSMKKVRWSLSWYVQINISYIKIVQLNGSMSKDTWIVLNVWNLYLQEGINIGYLDL